MFQFLKKKAHMKLILAYMILNSFMTENGF